MPQQPYMFHVEIETDDGEMIPYCSYRSPSLDVIMQADREDKIHLLNCGHPTMEQAEEAAVYLSTRCGWLVHARACMCKAGMNGVWDGI